MLKGPHFEQHVIMFSKLPRKNFPRAIISGPKAKLSVAEEKLSLVQKLY